MDTPEFEAIINRYANLIPSKPQRDYAWSYLQWLRRGAMGAEPEKPARCSRASAQAVRDEINRLTGYQPMRLRAAGR